VRLPRSAARAMTEAALGASHRLAGALAHRIVATTDDYARHSPYLRRFAAKTIAIAPPVPMHAAPPALARHVRAAILPAHKRPLLGMVARFAAEKGVEVLLDALPAILARYPRACVVFVGPYADVPGERAYLARLRPRLDAFIAAGQWRFLGRVDDDTLAALYAELDVLLLPSVNSTEAFGMVQVEAMLHGVPCVASDLPGVRHAVRATGLGALVPPGDAVALADAACDVLARFAPPRRPPTDLAMLHDPGRVAERYAALFRAAIGSRCPPRPESG
jgi:glycosyltransferase involved in cell wall biosynthesis